MLNKGKWQEDPYRPFTNMKWNRQLCSYYIVNDIKLLHVENKKFFRPSTNKTTCVTDNTQLLCLCLYTAALLQRPVQSCFLYFWGYFWVSVVFVRHEVVHMLLLLFFSSGIWHLYYILYYILFAANSCLYHFLKSSFLLHLNSRFWIEYTLMC